MPQIDNFVQHSKFYCHFSQLQMERPDQIFFDFPSGLRAEMKLCVCLLQVLEVARQLPEIGQSNYYDFCNTLSFFPLVLLPHFTIPWEMSQVGKCQRLQVPIAKAMRLVFCYLTRGLKDHSFSRQEMKQRLSSITT